MNLCGFYFIKQSKDYIWDQGKLYLGTAGESAVSGAA